MDALCLVFCRVGVAGLAPKAPGTWGSLVAAVLAPIFFLPLPLVGRVIVLCALFFFGALAATRAEELLGCEDPSEVVVDEWLGMWLALLPFATVSLTMLVMAFVFFRLFDIWKPWPVGASEHWMRQGYGIMLDDFFAGIMAMLCLVGLRCVEWL